MRRSWRGSQFIRPYLPKVGRLAGLTRKSAACLLSYARWWRPASSWPPQLRLAGGISLARPRPLDLCPPAAQLALPPCIPAPPCPAAERRVPGPAGPDAAARPAAAHHLGADHGAPLGAEVSAAAGAGSAAGAPRERGTPFWGACLALASAPPARCLHCGPAPAALPAALLFYPEGAALIAVLCCAALCRELPADLAKAWDGLQAEQADLQAKLSRAGAEQVCRRVQAGPSPVGCAQLPVPAAAAS